MKQRLAAILAADVVGYSRLMSADDIATVAALDAARAVFRARIEANQGRVIDMAGDSVLAVFQTAAGAVSAALAIQKELALTYDAVPEGQCMRHRIGVHLGDVIEKDDGTIYGDGVNIAARLEGLAEPGGISVSESIRTAVKAKVGANFEDQGEQQVKNIADPVRAYRVVPVGSAAAESHPASADTELPLPGKPSIAVLPFANMSGDPEQEYFADGITEDIITDIACVSGLFVIARNSTFVYKKQSVDVKEVGRKLGVRHVLEGSVRKAGMRVRITAQLIDVQTGGHVWAERFDRDLEDIFVVQDEVTRRIVDALKVSLTSVEESRRGRRSKVDTEAYDCLMRARNCILQFKAEAHIEARTLLERALVIDPAMAQVYAALAVLHAAEFLNGWNNATEGHLEQAVTWARKACELDGNDARTVNALAISLVWVRKLGEAEDATRRAIALDPNLSDAHGTLGNILHFTGRHEQAIVSYETALRLDPQFHLWMHAWGRVQFVMQRYAEAEMLFKRRLIHMPHSDVTRAYLASLYGHTGRIDEARTMWKELTRINPQYRIERTLQHLPYTDAEPLKQFVDGLRKAGLTQ